MEFIRSGLRFNVSFASIAKNPPVNQKKSRSLLIAVDWRQKGLVTGVKNQGGCGSCWAFSGIASLEGQYAKLTGKLVDFSEQNFVDCAYKSINHNGCHGGFPNEAFENVAKFGYGVNPTNVYPYTANVV